MVTAPILVLVLLLRRRHLVEGLLFGNLAAIVLALAFDRLAATDLMYIDPARYSARGLIIDGFERGLGISVFTLLLMGMVATLEATGLLARAIDAAGRYTRSARGAEVSIFALTSAAVLLTTHSVVAILTVGPFARTTGLRFGLDRCRRANLLDLTVCTYPFLLPYCIPTLLAASLTVAAEPSMPRLTPLAIGLHNFHSWALLGMVLILISTGWGRSGTPDDGLVEKSPGEARGSGE